MANPIDQYDGIFKAAGAEWNVDPVVLKALALHESGGDPNAGKNTSVGGQGLMQIVPGTQRQLGVTAPFDPQQSIYGGAKYLAMALDAEHDNPAAALRYYNGGPGWRTNPAADPKYANSVAAQYVKLAKADTGTLTDATPAATAQADAPDYNNQPAGPSAKPTAAAPDPYDAALKGKDASGGKATEPDAYTKALGTPAAKPGPLPGPIDNNPMGDQGGMGGSSMPAAPAVTGEDVRSFLAPAPNTTYGDILPLAKDNTTGAIRLALPNVIRNPLIGLTEGPSTDGTFGSSGVTWNPETGTYGLTPEAASVGQFAATPLRFSGANPLQFVPPGSLQRDPLPAGATALNPDAAARIRAAQGGPVPVEPPTVPTPFNTPTTAAVPGVSAEAAAAAAQAKPTSLPTGVPVTPPSAQLAPGGQMPTAAGAQISPTAVVGITPEQEAIYRSTADGQKLLEPQPIGVPDRNLYVRGNTPNLAEQEQTVNTARELKSLNISSPAVSQEAKQITQDFNENRGQHFTEASGTQHDIVAEEAVQKADIEGAKPKVFALSRAGDPAGVSDVMPIVEQIKQTMNEPINRQNDAIQKTLGDILNRLVDENGAPKITDPEELWGLRQRLDQMTGKFMTSQDSNLHYAAGTVSQVVKPLIDQAIEPAAPGFGDMLATYKAHAAKIEEMKLLQGYRNSLYAGSGGSMRMTFDKVQKMMRDIVDMQDPVLNDGVNPYQSIRPETMQKLWALRDDLRRSASAIELAKTPGSDTVQNVWDLIRGMATGPEAQAALHGFAASHFGVPGVLASTLGKRIIGPMIQGRTAAKQTQRGMEMLRPTNPLIQPNAPP